MSQQRVLVTGGSGFIGGHVVLAALARGYRVRTTVRSLAREDAVRTALTGAGMTAGDRLEFAAADLTRDDGWAAALDGVDHVVHVASPVMPGHVEDEQQLIVPAREGALRVLRAARDAGVGRVVLTSAFHAVAWGHPHDDHVFTEDDWTVLDGPGTDAYGRSKTLAERAAWDFTAEGGGAPELVTLLPVAVMGPLLGAEISGATRVIQRLLSGQVPGLLNLYFPVVDVRDVAAAHLTAVTAPKAAGQRFLLGSDPALSMAGIADILRTRLGEAAARVPTQAIPDEAVHAGAAENPALRAAVQDLGYARRFSTARARDVLGWDPRPSADAVAAAGLSLTEKGLTTP
ncbi:putative dihydrokaempferol 4-reductase [Actinacidiphila reveromycinica]|uniref:Putative dihydrokaempferol 4-reductase n=1 Tax=Actinacidiphila reveromycinica TaxID=659352 RepID=A0A7U3VPM6_9ACTN|nr:NAD-dependent epimerase/dehydratase family protein [Streptomyces sp. SN-593]BBA98829.1 putative dihydrokaempferol 4-reductase [Streptomyces sp. SN-593]